MATCRECLHQELCDTYSRMGVTDVPADDITICELFKSKSDYVKRERGGCEYCKEDSEGYRKMLGAFFVSYSFFDDKWFINTGHCKPRQIYFCPMCGRELKSNADMRKENNNA